MTNNILIIFTLSILFGCAQESRTPANFKLTLGAIESAGSEFPGGIILSGTNGSDQFKVGLTPSQISSYSIELPSGDWNFRAVGWLGETGTNESPIMTGEARCAYTRATIENEDTIIKMALSSDKCFDGNIASTAAEDGAPPVTGGTFFKRLNLESCLTTAGLTVGAPCDGSQLNNKIGESTSARIVFPGSSSFGASVSPLVSGCWNNTGYSENQIFSGNIPTSVRLPYGGGVPIPFHIVGFESKNCIDRTAVYRMTDGVDGTQGVSRIHDPSATGEVKVNFADNYIGHGGSAFADTASDLLPRLACQGKVNGCYPSISGFPRDSYASFKDNFKESIWRYIGNPQGYELRDIQPTASATTGSIMTDGYDLTISAPSELGGLKDGTSFFFNDTSAGTPVTEVTVSCAPGTYNIDYDSATHKLQDIINAISNPQCDNYEYFVSSSASDPINATFTLGNNITIFGGGQEFILERPQRGLLSRVERLLVGPIGAGLHKAGITSRELICNGTMDGSYDFVVDKDQVNVKLGSPSSVAVLPQFDANYMNTQFEKKITISMSGVPEEAFYFNCVDDVGVGSYLSDETNNNNDHPRKVQAFWDTRTVGSEAFEVASKRYNSSGQVIGREWFLFKGADTTGDFYHTWLMQASDPETYYSRAVGKADIVNDNFYVQGQDVSPTSTETQFSKQTNEQKYFLSQDQLQGPVTAVTVDPSAELPNMDIAPNFVSGYSLADLMNGPLLWDVKD